MWIQDSRLHCGNTVQRQRSGEDKDEFLPSKGLKLMRLWQSSLKNQFSSFWIISKSRKRIFHVKYFQHERSCKFRPYICPYIECDHKLAYGAVVEHVSSAHRWLANIFQLLFKYFSESVREECRRSDGPEITASMILIGMYFGGDGAWSPRVITCFGKTFFDVALTRDRLVKYFWLTAHLKYFSRWLHHWVWLLGEEEEAANYTYEITAFKGNTK